MYEHIYAAHCVVAAREGLQICGLEFGYCLLAAALCFALLLVSPSGFVGLRTPGSESHALKYCLAFAIEYFSQCLWLHNCSV